MSYKESSVIAKTTAGISDRVRMIIGEVSASITITNLVTVLTAPLQTAGFTLSTAVAALARVRTFTTVTSGTTILSNTDDILLANATGGQVDITLPLISADITEGREFTIKRNSSAANDVVITCDLADNIDGQTDITLDLSTRESVTLVANGTVWHIVSGDVYA